MGGYISSELKKNTNTHSHTHMVKRLEPLLTAIKKIKKNIHNNVIRAIVLAVHINASDVVTVERGM